MGMSIYDDKQVKVKNCSYKKWMKNGRLNVPFRETNSSALVINIDAVFHRIPQELNLFQG